MNYLGISITDYGFIFVTYLPMQLQYRFSDIHSRMTLRILNYYRSLLPKQFLRLPLDCFENKERHKRFHWKSMEQQYYWIHPWNCINIYSMKLSITTTEMNKMLYKSYCSINSVPKNRFRSFPRRPTYICSLNNVWFNH